MPLPGFEDTVSELRAFDFISNHLIECMDIRG
jgi:hypothetical protein